MTDIRDIHLKLPDNRSPISRRSGVSEEADLDDLSDSVFFDPPENESKSVTQNNATPIVTKNTTNNEDALTLKPFGYDKGKKNTDANRDSEDAGSVQKVKEENTIVMLRPFSFQKNSKAAKDDHRISAPVNVSSPQRSEKSEKVQSGGSRKNRKLVRQERVTSDELTLKPIGPALIHKNNNVNYVTKVDIKDDNTVEIGHIKEDKNAVVNCDEIKIENGQPLRRLGTIDVPVKDPKKGRMVYKLNGHTPDGQGDKLKAPVGKSYSGQPLIPEENRTKQTDQHEIPKQDRLNRQRGKRSVSFNQEKETKIKEGTDEEQGEMTMSKKFRRFARQMSETSAVTSSIRRKRRKRPNTFFDLALFACCCCCSPLGGLGMVFAVMSDTAHKARDYRKASKLRRATLGVSIAGIFLTIIVITILLITHAMRRMDS